MRRYSLKGHVTCLLCLMLANGCGHPSSAVIRIELECTDASAETMDEMVAVPLLNAIIGAPHVANIESLSFAGRTQIFVSLEHNGSIDHVAQRVRDALDGLPSGCRLLTPALFMIP